MNISVVVLTYNEEANIRECLESILKQEFFGGEWEVVVVDGMSTDRTCHIVKEFQQRSNRLRIVRNKKRKIAAGRALALESSRFPFIAFTDADCEVPHKWLGKLAQAYEDLSSEKGSVGGVGGGNIPDCKSSKFHRALGMYLDSTLGSFNSVQGRNPDCIKKVKSLPCLNVLYDKSALLEIGGFDETLGNIGEDLDINLRLGKAGYGLYFIPRIAVSHKLRPDLVSWMENMAVYGKGRVLVSLKHSLLNPFFVLPVMFAMAMGLTPLGFWVPLFLLPLLYFPVLGFYVLVISLKRKAPSLAPKIYSIFVFTHVVYSFSMLITILWICMQSIFKKNISQKSGTEHESFTN